MRPFINFILIFSLVLTGISCNEGDSPKLEPIEQRISNAVAELRSDLLAPSEGWRLDYSPNNGSGNFLMILKFSEDGTVNIQSDVGVNNGEFLNHTITYNVSSSIGLELIFDTYGVFHYLFELNRASFGAEFQLVFEKKEEDNLIFKSKSDITDDKTILTFVPAQSTDANELSPEIAENLQQFDGVRPIINFGAGAPGPFQHLILEDKNISVFWLLDVFNRSIKANYAATGTTQDEVNSSKNKLILDHETGFSLVNDKMILAIPLAFDLAGESITISEITFNDFNMAGLAFCPLGELTAVYNCQVKDQGAATMKQTLFSGTGIDFKPMTEEIYGVSTAFFIFDDSVRSLLEEGSIKEKLPDASGFLFHYGFNSIFNSPERPAYAVGFQVEDDDGGERTLLRIFEPTTTEGNKVVINFTDQFYSSEPFLPGEQQGLTEITDEIFEGGVIYAYDDPIREDTKIFRLFNPCNRYEFLLVR